MSRSSSYSGVTFQNQFRASCESAGYYVHRIVDKLYMTKNGLRSEKTPSDFFVVGEEPAHIYMVECKASGGKSIAFNALEPHQFNSLMEFEDTASNAHGVVAVNLYDPKNTRGYNRMFIVPIYVWDEYEKLGERKSIPLKTLESDERIVECSREKGSVWAIRTLR